MCYQEVYNTHSITAGVSTPVDLNEHQLDALMAHLLTSYSLYPAAMYKPLWLDMPTIQLQCENRAEYLQLVFAAVIALVPYIEPFYLKNTMYRILNQQTQRMGNVARVAARGLAAMSGWRVWQSRATRAVLANRQSL